LGRTEPKRVLDIGMQSEKWKSLPDQFKIDKLEEMKLKMTKAQRELLFPTQTVKGKVNKLPEIEGAISAEEKAEWMKLIEGKE